MGTLQHATKVGRPGRTFVSRMYSTAAKLKKNAFLLKTQYSLPVRLVWWHIFLQSWNGYSILRQPALLIPPDFTAQMDASGIWGCPTVLETEWSQWQWPFEWLSVGIVAKELVPNLFTCITWGYKLCRRSISFQCNNESLVAAIKKKSLLKRCTCNAPPPVFEVFSSRTLISPLQPPLLTTSHMET